MLKLTTRISKAREIFKYTHNRCRRYYSTSHSDEEDEFDDEVEDTLFETKRKEEFKELFSIKYDDQVPGFATIEGTEHYSLRSSLGNNTYL